MADYDVGLYYVLQFGGNVLKFSFFPDPSVYTHIHRLLRSLWMIRTADRTGRSFVTYNLVYEFFELLESGTFMPPQAIVDEAKQVKDYFVEKG